MDLNGMDGWREMDGGRCSLCSYFPAVGLSPGEPSYSASLSLFKYLFRENHAANITSGIQVTARDAWSFVVLIRTMRAHRWDWIPIEEELNLKALENSFYLVLYFWWVLRQNIDTAKNRRQDIDKTWIGEYIDAIKKKMHCGKFMSSFFNVGCRGDSS